MDTKSIAELKPCPFCGKPAWYDWNNDGNAKDLGCSDDDCAGHLVFSIWHTDIGTKHESEAIEAWNKRTQCQDVERLNKVIENYDLAGIEIRNDALEEAAEIAEEMHHGLIDRDFDKGSLTQQVAWEIRALKDKQ